MSRAHQIARHVEREEDRLQKDYAAGLISRHDYNQGLRDIAQEEREAYQADQDDAAEQVRNEWGGW